MNQRPRVLYKYLPASRLGVFDDLRIRFTQASDFNDPFESFPRVGPPSREALLRRLGPTEDLREMEARAAAFFPQVGPEMVFQLISETFGVLSISEGSDNSLLWAHYANAHRGFAIGFSPAHPWLTTQDQPMPPIDDVRPVVYQDDRPVVIVRGEEEATEARVLHEAEAMLFTKARVWEYEREWRLVRLLDRSATVLDPATAHGSPVHLFDIPPDAISEVVLGARMETADVRRVRARLAQPDLAHVRLRVARRSPTTFSLDVLDQETA